MPAYPLVALRLRAELCCLLLGINQRDLQLICISAPQVGSMHACVHVRTPAWLTPLQQWRLRGRFGAAWTCSGGLNSASGNVHSHAMQRRELLLEIAREACTPEQRRAIEALAAQLG